MAATGMILASGEELGGYRILEPIGIGGMAIVYRAEQLRLGREVAVKVLAPTIANDDAFRERFRREGKLVAALEHPNIIAIHDADEVDGRLFLVMRLVRGGTLADRLRVSGITAEDAVNLLEPVADALDAAHAAGVVHRDVKPQNILIDEDGRPYLADFGVARTLVTTNPSAAGGFVGSHNYAAPEQIRGLAITSATDIYALTAVLFECLAGHVPYGREHVDAILHAQLFDARPTVDPSTPGGSRLNSLVACGMAVAPDERFATASELITQARGVIDDLTPAQKASAPAFAEEAARSTAAAERAAQPTATVQPATGAPITDSVTALPPADRGPVTAQSSPAEGADVHRRTRRRAHGRLLGVGVALFAGVIAVTLIALTGSAHGHQQHRVNVPPFSLTYASPWRSVRGPIVGSFALDAGSRGARSGTPARAVELRMNAATLAAGPLAASSRIPGGVPPQLRARFGAPKSSGDLRVAGHPARVYRWDTHGRSLVAYVLPMPDGDAAILCAAPAGSSADVKACARIADRVRVTGPTIAPGVDRSLQAALTSALSRVSSLSRSLGRDASLPARETTAASAARIASQAASSLATLAAAPRYGAALGRIGHALRLEASSLTALAHAAATDDRTAYGHQAAALAAASRSLQTAFRGLSAYGVKVPIPGQIHLGQIHVNLLPYPTTTGPPPGGVQTSTGVVTTPPVYRPQTTVSPVSPTHTTGGKAQTGKITETPPA